jgi:drug/metabolite transporter (DMT)-like permease
LKQLIGWVKWSGIFLVILGLVTVGLTDHFDSVAVDIQPPINTVVTQALAEEAVPQVSDMVIGDILIIFAQVIVAFQVTYEEKFVTKYKVNS